jgi:glycosyltransferase involved in cell wall biosynthesis
MKKRNCMNTPHNHWLTVVLPVLNEEAILADHVREVRERLRSDFPGGGWLIVVADSASDDRTPQIASALVEAWPEVRHVRTPERGKGRGIRAGWEAYPAAVNVFMDADLATDLSALRPLVEAVRGGAAMAVGSRFHAASKVKRSLFRKVVSQAYRLLIKRRLGLVTDDAPCGFKAVSGEVLRRILPEVRDDRWFFDTELLVRTERAGLSVVVLPVRWVERPGRVTRVNVARVTWQYLAAVEALRRELGR